MPVGSQTGSALSRVYDGIANALQAAGRPGTRQRWLVTGVLPGDGATTTAVGIARALAAQQESGLLVDANLRNPAISRRLGDRSRPGLVQVVLNGHTLSDACRQDGEIGDFAVLPAGGEKGVAASLLSRPRTVELLDELPAPFDCAVIDAPALAEGRETLSMAAHVDGCVLVVRAGRTGRRALVKAKHDIEQAGGEVLGVVLNRHKQWIPRVVRRWL